MITTALLSDKSITPSYYSSTQSNNYSTPSDYSSLTGYKSGILRDLSLNDLFDRNLDLSGIPLGHPSTTLYHSSIQFTNSNIPLDYFNISRDLSYITSDVFGTQDDFSSTKTWPEEMEQQKLKKRFSFTLHIFCNISASCGPILNFFLCFHIYIKFPKQWLNPHPSILNT